MSHRSYDLAVHFLKMMHATLPLKAKITDFKDFEPDSNTSFSYSVTTQMIEWCDKWAPLVENAIATHRDKMLRELNN